jgi:hypothetical protein
VLPPIDWKNIDLADPKEPRPKRQRPEPEPTTSTPPVATSGEATATTIGAASLPIQTTPTTTSTPQQQQQHIHIYTGAQNPSNCGCHGSTPIHTDCYNVKQQCTPKQYHTINTKPPPPCHVKKPTPRRCQQQPKTNPIDIPIFNPDGDLNPEWKPHVGHEKDFKDYFDEIPSDEPSPWGGAPLWPPEEPPDDEEDDEQHTYTPPPVSGCTDPTATNYNAAATIDDGSCIYQPPPVSGCTDPTATNYNAAATIDDGSCIYPPSECPITGVAYTPDINVFIHPQYGGIPGMNRATELSQAVSSVTDQSPYGIGWISAATWAAADWDGVTTLDLGTMTTAQACSWLWPAGGDVLRGTRQAYDNWCGFADPTAPTAKEIEAWTVKYILHFRNLTRNPTPLELDRCLMMRCLWADERWATTYWDAEYNTTGCGNAAGPCAGVCTGTYVNPHCGDAFFPNAEDQVPYMLASGGEIATCPATITGGGIYTTKNNIPWSIKLSRVMQYWFCSKDSGHFGPFLGREKLGFHWMVYAGEGTTWRNKWSGCLNQHITQAMVPTDWAIIAAPSC